MANDDLCSVATLAAPRKVFDVEISTSRGKKPVFGVVDIQVTPSDALLLLCDDGGMIGFASGEWYRFSSEVQ